MAKYKEAITSKIDKAIRKTRDKYIVREGLVVKCIKCVENVRYQEKSVSCRIQEHCNTKKHKTRDGTQHEFTSYVFEEEDKEEEEPFVMPTVRRSTVRRVAGDNELYYVFDHQKKEEDAGCHSKSAEDVPAANDLLKEAKRKFDTLMCMSQLAVDLNRITNRLQRMGIRVMYKGPGPGSTEDLLPLSNLTKRVIGVMIADNLINPSLNNETGASSQGSQDEKVGQEEEEPEVEYFELNPDDDMSDDTADTIGDDKSLVLVKQES